MPVEGRRHLATSTVYLRWCSDYEEHSSKAQHFYQIADTEGWYLAPTVLLAHGCWMDDEISSRVWSRCTGCACALDPAFQSDSRRRIDCLAKATAKIGRKCLTVLAMVACAVRFPLRAISCALRSDALSTRVQCTHGALVCAFWDQHGVEELEVS